MNSSNSTKIENKENNEIIHTLKKRIKINEIKNYAFPNVSVDEDVIDNRGAVLIPKGTVLAALSKYASNLENSLNHSGIRSLSILINKQLEVMELESIIKLSNIDFMKIEPKFARDTVERLSDVYSRIASETCETEDIINLVDQGRSLAKIVIQTPEILFCLGHVRGSDEYTYVHSLNVALICGFMSNKLFPNDEDMVQCLTIGGILHDFGKAKIPNEILNKPGPLSVTEFEIMKKHTVYGEDLAKKFGVFDPRILSVIRGHHERYSGNGYPDVLQHEKISIEARIAAVADVFDALTGKRVYKEPMGCRNAIIMMIEEMSMHFDPVALHTLVISIGLYPPGAFVELSDGSSGVVVGTSGKDLVRPQVMITYDKDGKKIENVEVIDLNKSVESIFIKQVIKDTEKTAY
jgi:HD-GYP domain-containing protein (c-di-GMP phosphodiesterase class II)